MGYFKGNVYPQPSSSFSLSDRGVNDAHRAARWDNQSQSARRRMTAVTSVVSHKLAFRERAAIPQRRDSADATPLTDQTPERQTAV